MVRAGGRSRRLRPLDGRAMFFPDSTVRRHGCAVRRGPGGRAKLQADAVVVGEIAGRRFRTDGQPFVKEGAAIEKGDRDGEGGKDGRHHDGKKRSPRIRCGPHDSDLR